MIDPSTETLLSFTAAAKEVPTLARTSRRSGDGDRGVRGIKLESIRVVAVLHRARHWPDSSPQPLPRPMLAGSIADANPAQGGHRGGRQGTSECRLVNQTKKARRPV